MGLYHSEDFIRDPVQYFIQFNGCMWVIFKQFGADASIQLCLFIKLIINASELRRVTDCHVKIF